MDPKKMYAGSKDLLSNLPDGMICHILSFLSTKEAALTSVLSKRWRFLLAFVPNLVLDNSIYDLPIMGREKSLHLRKSFKLFVDRVMALQGDAPLNKFSLKYKDDFYIQSPVDGWIDNVLERSVEELDLYIVSQLDYMLPPMVLMSKNLVKLKLKGSDHFVVEVGEVFLPKLKTLQIHNVAFDDDGDETGAQFSKLISSCHALEELVVITDWIFWNSFSVSNPNLKRLLFFCLNTITNLNRVSLDTPNLLHLEFTGTVAAKYPKVNLDSLVEASIRLRMTPVQLDFGCGYSTDFFMGLSNAKILYLLSDTLEVLNFCCKAIPVFNNLLHLTIETSREVEWKAMPKLLENCPNLETLVFKGLHYRDTHQCSDVGYRFKDTHNCFENDKDGCVCKPWHGTPIWLSSSPVKTLKILKFKDIIADCEKQLDLIKYFVETMPKLEEVILYHDTSFDVDVTKLSTEFRKLEKVASSNCKIQVISDGFGFSSTVSSSSSSPSGLVFFESIFPV